MLLEKLVGFSQITKILKIMDLCNVSSPEMCFEPASIACLSLGIHRPYVYLRSHGLDEPLPRISQEPTNIGTNM